MSPPFLRSGFLNPAFSHFILYTSLVGLAAAVAFTLHEMAHYIVAVISGVRAEKVIIGFGPEIWRRRGGNGTQWSLRLFPFCGRVHLHPHSAAEAAEGPRSHLFTQLSPLRQILIVAAGPIGNVFTAFAALALFFTAAGLPSVPPIVGGVMVDGPAARAGIRPGDEIVALDGNPVERLEDVMRSLKAGQPMTLTLRRARGTVTARVTPEFERWQDEQGFSRERALTGILPVNVFFKFSQIEAIDGVPVKDDADKARALLLARLGGTATLSAHANDRQVRDYLVDVPRQENRALGRPGPVQDMRLAAPQENFYYPGGPLAAAREAAHETGRLASGFVHIFAHTYPFDVARIKPETTVSDRLAPGRAVAYVFAHKIAEWSICLAVLNLLPVPGTDGWFILYIAAGAIAGWRRAPRLRLRIIQVTLFALLGAWTLINFPVILGGLH